MPCVLTKNSSSIKESEDLETVGPQGLLLQAQRDEAGGGSLNHGGVVAAAKNTFIVVSEKSRLLVG